MLENDVFTLQKYHKRAMPFQSRHSDIQLCLAGSLCAHYVLFTWMELNVTCCHVASTLKFLKYEV